MRKWKHILMLFGILILGMVLIIAPDYIKNRVKEKKARVEAERLTKEIKKISSKNETIDIPELNMDLEAGIYDEQQIFFDDILKLYDYFSFQDIEAIKQRIQRYIHSNINAAILDCSIGDVKTTPDKVIFNVLINNNFASSKLEIEVTKPDKTIEDILIIETIETNIK